MFSGIKALVVGDIILDKYILGRSERISPEAPVPVVDVEKVEFRLGGAANVANNLVSLGAEADLAGVIGKDVAGAKIMELVQERGIGFYSIIPEKGRVTTEKTRVIANGKHLCRIDSEVRVPITPESEARILEAMKKGYDVIIISDYGKGVVTRRIARMAGRLSLGGSIVVIDPKEPHFSYYRWATCVKPNKREAETASKVKLDGVNLQALREAAERLQKLWRSKMILITLGADGMYLYDEEDGGTYIPGERVDVYDVCGAGDTALAVFAAALASGRTPVEAAQLANRAASIVVTRVGTSTVTGDDLRC